MAVVGVVLEARANAMEGDNGGENSSFIKVFMSPDIKPVWICVGRTVPITGLRFTEAGGTIVTCIFNAPLRLVANLKPKVDQSKAPSRAIKSLKKNITCK